MWALGVLHGHRLLEGDDRCCPETGCWPVAERLHTRLPLLLPWELSAKGMRLLPKSFNNRKLGSTGKSHRDHLKKKDTPDLFVEM